jgi:uncharacterized protein
MMNHDNYPQGHTQDWLAKVKTIAVVGASPNAARPSFGVMQLLISRGYEVTPVNPGQAGKDILGRTVVSALADLPGPVDMIDVFRASEAIPAIADEILALTWKPKLVWLQLGIRNDDAAAKLEAAGISVIMNRCPAIELGH